MAAEDGYIQTGLTRFGTVVGDQAEIGYNAVINASSILGAITKSSRCQFLRSLPEHTV